MSVYSDIIPLNHIQVKNKYSRIPIYHASPEYYERKTDEKKHNGVD